MSDNVDSQDTPDEETGSALRQKLEAALAEKRAYQSKTAELVAKDFKHVKPDDLKDLSVDDMASKAAEIEQARDTERKDVFKTILAEKGIEEDQLNEVLSSFFSDDKSEASQTVGRVASLGGLDGTPVRRNPAEDVAPGPDRIKAALAAQNK